MTADDVRALLKEEELDLDAIHQGLLALDPSEAFTIVKEDLVFDDRYAELIQRLSDDIDFYVRMKGVVENNGS